ncbi:MAG TPA: glutamate--tRNA ligase family protein [Candidatus Levybacteria bacterium]|nr:glutamate--tRNA ligase family protein [Candidatus Levybacteria bacterium]
MEVGDIRKIKTRFAPSPTGSLHVGGIRTALFNYFLAKVKNGTFMLRIEDTDQQRKVEGAEEQIKESLEWLGANWDEFVVQSQRLSEYKKYAEKLLAEGKAKLDNGAIRFIVSKEGKTAWNDAIGDKEIIFENKDIEDFIILKGDGYPTYHLASVVDDHMMNITHVIRGEDWISSTPKHIMLYSALGWSVPVFAHVPNVFGTDGKKLSKRRGAKSALDYKKEGILSDALLNYLMLLGWSPKNDREIFSKEEIEKEFTLENVNSSPAIFDEKKLLWVNGEHIRLLTTESLQERLLEFDPTLSGIANFTKYLSLAQTRMKTLAEFRGMVEDTRGVELSDKQRQLAGFLLDKYKSISRWNTEEILQASLAARDMSDAKTQDLYVVLTGKTQGLPFAEKLEIEGKDATIKKLQ